MQYDWKAIIEQEEKKICNFFNLIQTTLPTYELDQQKYEETFCDIYQIRILPFNIEELKDAKQVPRV